MQDAMTNYARQKGWMPDWAWYQLNGKSIQENYAEQHEEIMNLYAGNGDALDVHFVSEVKLK